LNGQGHRSKFTVTGENVATAVGATSRVVQFKKAEPRQCTKASYASDSNFLWRRGANGTSFAGWALRRQRLQRDTAPTGVRVLKIWCKIILWNLGSLELMAFVEANWGWRHSRVSWVRSVLYSPMCYTLPSTSTSVIGIRWLRVTFSDYFVRENFQYKTGKTSWRGAGRPISTRVCC